MTTDRSDSRWWNPSLPSDSPPFLFPVVNCSLMCICWIWISGQLVPSHRVKSLTAVTMCDCVPPERRCDPCARGSRGIRPMDSAPPKWFGLSRTQESRRGHRVLISPPEDRGPLSMSVFLPPKTQQDFLERTGSQRVPEELAYRYFTTCLKPISFMICLKIVGFSTFFLASRNRA